MHGSIWVKMVLCCCYKRFILNNVVIMCITYKLITRIYFCEWIVTKQCTRTEILMRLVHEPEEWVHWTSIKIEAKVSSIQVSCRMRVVYAECMNTRPYKRSVMLTISLENDHQFILLWLLTVYPIFLRLDSKSIPIMPIIQMLIECMAIAYTAQYRWLRLRQYV